MQEVFFHDEDKADLINVDLFSRLAVLSPVLIRPERMGDCGKHKNPTVTSLIFDYFFMDDPCKYFH